MAGTGEGKKEEADYKRLHSFPLIRVGEAGQCLWVQDNPDCVGRNPFCTDNITFTLWLYAFAV